jgi:hypothetical protein
MSSVSDTPAPAPRSSTPCKPERDYDWLWWVLIMVVLPTVYFVWSSANADATPHRSSVSDEDLYGCSYTDHMMYGC